MTRRLWLRIGIVVVVAAVAAFYLYPPKKTINLGLDLQGGIHLVLGVGIDKALQVQTERAGDTVRAALEKKGVSVKSIERRGHRRHRPQNGVQRSTWGSPGARPSSQ